MKADDIVRQLLSRIPQLTDTFTNNVDVVSVTRAGTTRTVTTSVDHLLAVNSLVSLAGALTPLNIDSLTRTGDIGTLVTALNHDITEPTRFNNGQTRTTVILSGSTEPEFNGTFQFLTVPNRKTITFTMADSGPTVATGASILENGSSFLQNLSKLYRVTGVPTNTTFTVEEPNTAIPDPVGTITARKNCQISLAIDPLRVLDSYTEKTKGQTGTQKDWAFVVLGDSSAPQSLNTQLDVQATQTPSQDWCQFVEFPFSIFVVMTTGKDEIAAGKARDRMSELLPTLTQSVSGVQFPTGLQGGNGYTSFVASSFYAYDTAFYVAEFQFAQVSTISFKDTVGPSPSVAFRDLDFNIETSLDGVTVSAEKTVNTIDLDDVDL